jgi:hypothetical protein
MTSYVQFGCNYATQQAGCVVSVFPILNCEKRRFEMMHVTGDGKRMSVTNSPLSTLEHSGQFCVRLVHISPDGMKFDPVLQHRPEPVQDRPGAGAWHVDQLRVHAEETERPVPLLWDTPMSDSARRRCNGAAPGLNIPRGPIPGATAPSAHRPSADSWSAPGHWTAGGMPGGVATIPCVAVLRKIRRISGTARGRKVCTRPDSTGPQAGDLERAGRVVTSANDGNRRIMFDVRATMAIRSVATGQLLGVGAHCSR